jgi:ribosomal protein S6
MAKGKEPQVREDDELVDEGGSRVYELGFHLDPELPSEEVKKAYQEIRALAESKGSVVAEGEPQKIQLAYTISRQETSGRRDFDSAYFAWVAYETSAPNHEEVLEGAKADTRIIRFIDLVTTKEMARHAAEMRELALQEPEAAPEEEAAADDAALDAALENAAI